MRRLLAVLVLAAAGVGAVLVLTGGDDGEDSNPRSHARVRTPERMRARERRDRARTRVPGALMRIADRLPVDRRVAQLFLVGFDGTDVGAPIFPQLQRRGWGGIAIGAANYGTPDELAALAGEAGVVARNAGEVAPLVALQEPGVEQAVLARQGARGVRETTRTAAARLREQGISLVMAPLADVGYTAGPADGPAFSDDPRVVARLVRASVDGWLAGGVVPAVAHFPGQGAASQDPLEGPTSVGLDTRQLRANDLRPFEAALRRAPAVTVSSAAYAAYDSVTPASLTPGIVRGVLRGELGFRGAALSDDLNGVAAATGTTVADAAVAALRAGVDLLYVPDPAEVEPAYEAVLDAVRDGKLSPGRVREALLRVLVLKREAGLV